MNVERFTGTRALQMNPHVRPLFAGGAREMDTRPAPPPENADATPASSFLILPGGHG